MNKLFYPLAALAAVVALTASAQAADLKHGADLAAQGGCAGCHGAQFDKPVAPNYPIIAGQPASYLVHAMRQYQAQHQTPIYGRNNPVMGGMVARFSDDDLHAIADYIASLPTPLYAPDTVRR